MLDVNNNKVLLFLLGLLSTIALGAGAMAVRDNGRISTLEAIVAAQSVSLARIEAKVDLLLGERRNAP